MRVITVTTTAFSICINGDIEGFFKGGRGLTQGMKLSHICFADDLLVLCHGDVTSVNIMKNSITDFGEVSGLLPNFNISTILLGSVDLTVQNNILNILPFEVGVLPMKYLGVPLLDKRLGLKIAVVLLKRLQLVASMLSAMQIYWASVYALPIGVVDEIDKLLKGFLWSQTE
ncbi:uncharacterized protein [Rutidosis leptorrhynchoides]|uniref:uncharacterized protein n=1 Tax=Rutidosis leptorrhynchoides TaxID=125765 RepID=UPI003A993AF9